MRLHGFCVRDRESESTAVFSQLPLHCVLTTTAQGRTVCCSRGGRRHPTPLWTTEPWQWPLLVKVCCQKNTEEGQKAGWGGKGKTQPEQRSRNPTYLLKKASGLPKMHKWLTSLWSLHMSHVTLSFCTMKIYDISGVLRPVWELKCSPSRDSPKVY